MAISHSYKAKSKREDRKIANNWTVLLILSISIYLVHKHHLAHFLVVLRRFCDFFVMPPHEKYAMQTVLTGLT